MMVLWAFLANIGLFSIVPLYLATIDIRRRAAAFYVYISCLMLLGGFVGAIYSFPLTENITISGGNIAYGAVMMSVVMLIIIEQDISTFHNLIRLVVLVDVFNFFLFNSLAWLLDSNLVLNPLNVSPDVFRGSLWILILGGVLILTEILALLFVFLQVRKITSKISLLALMYTLVFFLILCLDGILFPLLAFIFNSASVHLVFGNISSKLAIAAAYSVPMLIFYWIFRQNFAKFLEAPPAFSDLLVARRQKLLETLQYYEVREEQLQREKHSLTEAISRDELTSIANRRKFDLILELEWSRCLQQGLPLTLVIGDVDFFKQYNDLYGHQQGDECLQKIASLWDAIFTREGDLAARIGGEEFAIILPGMTPEQALASLHWFMGRLRSRAIPHEASLIAKYVTMSVGVAGGIPKNNSSLKELFALADHRLYVAKRRGRDQIVASGRSS